MLFFLLYLIKKRRFRAKLVENFDFLTTPNDILGGSNDDVYNILLMLQMLLHMNNCISYFHCYFFVDTLFF